MFTSKIQKLNDIVKTRFSRFSSTFSTVRYYISTDINGYCVVSFKNMPTTKTSIQKDLDDLVGTLINNE